MSRKFPTGFLKGFLADRKVSCFLCTNSHPGNRKLSAQRRVSHRDLWFPRQETVSTPGNQKFPRSFLNGFLKLEAACPTY